MIKVRNITMCLSSGGLPITILDKINLEIPKGQFVSIIGKSGSGKTTLLSLTAGLDKPTDGEITINGKSLSGLSEDKLARLRGKHIGFIFQSYQLIPTLTALENVALPIGLNGGDLSDRGAEDLLVSVGLQDRLHHYPLQLSGGEQQRVAVARAFACSPLIILADEPTGNLDSQSGEKVIDLLYSMHKNHNSTMMLVTHDSSLAERTDRVITLADGRVISDKLNNS